MENLSELAFEQILNHLSLEDRLKSRGVSRRWYHTINSFRVNTLCYSDRPLGFIVGNRRLADGAFTHNFINAPRFERFVQTIGPTLLSNLKRLRFCDLRFTIKKRGPSLVSTLNSFVQLEELSLTGLQLDVVCSLRKQLELNLPMLQTIQLKRLSGIDKITLDTPRLWKIELVEIPFVDLDIVHYDSVERLIIEYPKYSHHLPFYYKRMNELKNLKILYYSSEYYNSQINSMYLPSLISLNNLQEIHLNNRQMTFWFLEEKLLHNRPYLKVYCNGVLLDGDAPSVMCAKMTVNPDEYFGSLLENQSRLADEIPFCKYLHYTGIEFIDSEATISIANRLSNLEKVLVKGPVENTEHFLNFLKNFDKVASLEFLGPQPQDLFDRLPNSLQSLTIHSRPSNLRFLLKLNRLVRLHLDCPVDAEFIWDVSLSLEYLSRFKFEYNEEKVTIEINRHKTRFLVSIGGYGACVSDLNAAIQLIKNPRALNPRFNPKNPTNEEDLIFFHS